jgi:acetolactate synthase-1/2/3 large subunit
MNVKAANGLVRILKKEGVGWVSTFPTNIFTNACGEEGVENLMVRDERFAVAVADGFSRVSDGKRFGVCSLMGGLNAAGTEMAYGAIAQAYEDSTPLLCLTDGVPGDRVGLERFNIEDGFMHVSKWTGYINRGSRVPEFMRRAFTMLRTGRPSPVLLQLPGGLEEYEEDNYPYEPVKGWRSQADPADVRQAVRAIREARKPMIFAGQGVFYADACGELKRLSELLQLPVLTTLKGKSAFPEDHPLSLGVTGPPAERFLKTSDLVFTVGYGFNPSQFAHAIPRGKRIVQLALEESDVNRGYPVDHVVLGDAKLVLGQMIEEAERQGAVKRPGLLEEIEVVRKEKMAKYESFLASDERPVNPYRVYNEMMGVLDPSNSFVTHESGNTRDQLVTVYEARIPHGFLGWGNVSTLGFGLGASMGARLAFPERQVVSVTGDAGFGYQVGNYEVLIRNKMGITTIHINNSGFGGYGPGFWGPGHSPYTSKVTPSDIVHTAKAVEGLGIASERVEDPDEIAPALKRALKLNGSGKPAFIEVICKQHPVYGGWMRA